MEGYGTYQELAYYRYFGRALQPDIVVLAFFVGNDFRDNMVSTRQGRLINPVLVSDSGRFAVWDEPVLRDRGENPLRDPLSGALVPHPGREWLVWLARRSLVARLLGSRISALRGRWTGDLALLDLEHRYYYYEIGLYQKSQDARLSAARALTLECLDALQQIYAELGKREQADWHGEFVERVFSGPGPLRRFWWDECVSRGTIFALAGQWAAAEREFTWAARLLPDDPVAFYNLGLLYQRTGRAQRAQEYFGQAQTIAPDFTPARGP